MAFGKTNATLTVCILNDGKPPPTKSSTDKRIAFYTLWLVIIFGGISILLAFASLVVSALQAWAAFHTPGT